MTLQDEGGSPHSVHPQRELADRTRVLKHGDTFAVFDEYGDAQFSQRVGSDGVYHNGTRYLSRECMLVGGARPLLLSSTITDDNTLLAIDMANAELFRGDQVVMAADTLHIFRSKFLYRGTCFQRLRIKNHGRRTAEFEVSFEFESDFADIFEIRGEKRPRRGRCRELERSARGMSITYDGLDDKARTARLRWNTDAVPSNGRLLRFSVVLEPEEDREIHLELRCETEEEWGSKIGDGTYDGAYHSARNEVSARRQRGCEISTSNELFNRWLERSFADVAMMITDTTYGPYPYAGVPWFNTIFGRDGLITALEMLWVDAAPARGVLRTLAATQATRCDDIEDAEPGKIVHEMRAGEMAQLREVPFSRYYGTIDATPLFIVLAAAYYRRTGDLALIDELWPNIEAALGWLDEYGDCDGDGFVEYARHSPDGLEQQGWKDANDSVFYANGILAKPPIALCEVQGYVFAALNGMAELSEIRGEHERGAELRGRAKRLREAFEQQFWSDEIGSYVLALDGDKRPCTVRTSNAGHCLFTGIATRDRALRVSNGLMTSEMFSGWGVRTLASGSPRYNPMAYHNGSIWPHDNALVCAGLARYGHKQEAARILSAMFDLSSAVDLHRMPELLCGFVRRAGHGPTLYPVACAPQAWAAAAVFMMIQDCLGLQIDEPGRELAFENPVLPDCLDWIRIQGLDIGGDNLDVLVRRAGADVTVEVLANNPNIDVAIYKRRV